MSLIELVDNQSRSASLRRTRANELRHKGEPQTRDKPMTTHKQVTLSVCGELITVDKSIREVALLLNNLPGVATYNSCQGGHGERNAYVQFGGIGAFLLLPPLARAILREEQIWTRKHNHVCRGCRGMSVKLEICGDGMALRWQPWDYRRVLRIVAAAKRGARQTR